MGNYPAFKVCHNAAQTISHNTVTTVDYSTVWKDHNGNANMAADPSKFTCTVPGLYWFSHHIYLNLGATHASILTYYYSYLFLNHLFLLLKLFYQFFFQQQNVHKKNSSLFCCQKNWFFL